MSPEAPPGTPARKPRAPASAPAPAGNPPTAATRPRMPPPSAARATPAAAAPLPPLAPPAPAVSRRRVQTGNPSADFTRGVFEVARKEVLQNVRTKRLLIIGIVMVFLLVMVTLVFGPNIMENSNPDGVVSLEHQVLVFYFAVGIIGGLQFTQMLAIVLTSDAVCSEWASRTLFLLLSKPVSRTAFVIGKFLGAAFTVCATLAVLFSLDYLLMQPFYEGSPSGEEVGGFFAMVGVVLLGATAFAAFSLFISTLTKSTTMSVLLVLAAWLILFPVLGNIGFFMEIGRDEPDLDSARVDSWRYLNPAGDMQAGARLLVPDESELDDAVAFFNIFQTAPEHVSWSIVALLIHIVVWVGLALAVVQRRNFE